jgi:membrane-associated phospholipid phosphatase
MIAWAGVIMLCVSGAVRGQAPTAATPVWQGTNSIPDIRIARGLAVDTLPRISKYRYSPHLGLSDRTYWAVAGGALAAGVLLDHTAGPAVRSFQTPFLTRITPLGDAFGTANYTVPTVTGTLVIAHLARNVDWEDATRHITLSYILADMSEALLKGAVGRQRPSYSGNADPWVFKPFSFSDEWHSFPSAHLTHITAIAAAFAEEADRPWTTALSASAVAFTGWQRLYRDQHWMSDVIGGMIVGTAASRVTAHWLRHHRQPTAAR